MSFKNESTEKPQASAYAARAQDYVIVFDPAGTLEEILQAELHSSKSPPRVRYSSVAPNHAASRTKIFARLKKRLTKIASRQDEKNLEAAKAEQAAFFDAVKQTVTEIEEPHTRYRLARAHATATDMLRFEDLPSISGLAKAKIFNEFNVLDRDVANEALLEQSALKEIYETSSKIDALIEKLDRDHSEIVNIRRSSAII